MRNMAALFGLLLSVLLAVPAGAQDYDKGIAAYSRGDFATALKEWRPLAEQGFVKAQYNLGVMYANGHGVPQDYTEAVKWYRLAAEQGNSGAQNNAAWILATASEPTLRNGTEAVRLAQQAVADRAEANTFGTLAAAYAETGQFDNAVTEQQRAIEILRAAGKNGEVADFESRLDLYRRHQPYRER